MEFSIKTNPSNSFNHKKYHSLNKPTTLSDKIIIIIVLSIFVIITIIVLISIILTKSNNDNDDDNSTSNDLNNNSNNENKNNNDNDKSNNNENKQNNENNDDKKNNDDENKNDNDKNENKTNDENNNDKKNNDENKNDDKNKKDDKDTIKEINKYVDINKYNEIMKKVEEKEKEGLQRQYIITNYLTKEEKIIIVKYELSKSLNYEQLEYFDIENCIDNLNQNTVNIIQKRIKELLNNYKNIENEKNINKIISYYIIGLYGDIISIRYENKYNAIIKLNKIFNINKKYSFYLNNYKTILKIN